MKVTDYLGSYTVEVTPKSYVTGQLTLIRQLSRQFADAYGICKYTPVAATKNGKRVGYGLSHWKDGKPVLVTMRDIQRVQRFVPKHEVLAL